MVAQGRFFCKDLIKLVSSFTNSNLLKQCFKHISFIFSCIFTGRGTHRIPDVHDVYTEPLIHQISSHHPRLGAWQRHSGLLLRKQCKLPCFQTCRIMNILIRSETVAGPNRALTGPRGPRGANQALGQGSLVIIMLGVFSLPSTEARRHDRPQVVHSFLTAFCSL